jgi:hypothetical protein
MRRAYVHMFVLERTVCVGQRPAHSVVQKHGWEWYSCQVVRVRCTIMIIPWWRVICQESVAHLQSCWTKSPLSVTRKAFKIAPGRRTPCPTNLLHNSSLVSPTDSQAMLFTGLEGKYLSWFKTILVGDSCCETCAAVSTILDLDWSCSRSKSVAKSLADL